MILARLTLLEWLEKFSIVLEVNIERQVKKLKLPRDKLNQTLKHLNSIKKHSDRSNRNNKRKKLRRMKPRISKTLLQSMQVSKMQQLMMVQIHRNNHPPSKNANQLINSKHLLSISRLARLGIKSHAFCKAETRLNNIRLLSKMLL